MLLPKEICTEIAAMIPQTAVEIIAENIHYIITEDELKTEEEIMIYPMCDVHFTRENCCDLWTYEVSAEIDTMTLFHTNGVQHRNIISISMASEFTGFDIHLNIREMSQLNLKRRSFAIAERIIHRLEGILVECHFDKYDYDCPTAQRKAFDNNERAVAIYNQESRLMPSVLKEVNKFFTENDIRCAQKILPIIEESIMQKTILSDQDKTTNVLAHDVEKRSVFAFSKFLDITGRDLSHANRDYHKILKIFSENGWDKDIISYHKGGSHKSSEIYFTSKGFLSIFTIFSDDESMKMRGLITSLADWTLKQMAIHNMKLQDRLHVSEVETKLLKLDLDVSEKKCKKLSSDKSFLRKNRLHHVAPNILGSYSKWNNYYNRINALFSRHGSFLIRDGRVPYIRNEYMEEAICLIKTLKPRVSRTRIKLSQ